MKPGQLQVAIERALEHDLRLAFTENEVFDDEENEHLHKYQHSCEIRKNWTNSALAAYNERTKQRTQLKDFHFSYVQECTAETTPEEVYESIGKFLEDKIGSKVYNISIHKDEGVLLAPPDFDENYPLKSGVAFFKNFDTGEFFWDKKFTKPMAKNLDELKKIYKIKKNYHAHIEFSAMRADGTSLKKYASGDSSANRRLKKQGETGLKRDESRFLKIDKYFLLTIKNRFTGLLNDKLNEQGKEIVILREETDEERPKLKRDKGFFYLKDLERRLKNGETLTKAELKTYKTLAERSNRNAQILYDAKKELERNYDELVKDYNEIVKDYNELVSKKWNKSRAKQVLSDFFEHWNTRLDETAILSDFERKEFFQSAANELKELDCLKNDFVDWHIRLIQKTQELETKIANRKHKSDFESEKGEALKSLIAETEKSPKIAPNELKLSELPESVFEKIYKNFSSHIKHNFTYEDIRKFLTTFNHTNTHRQ